MSILIKASQPHDSCGGKRSLSTYDDNEHCFKCGYHKNKFKKSFQIAEAKPPRLLWTGGLPDDVVNISSKQVPAEYFDWLNDRLDISCLPPEVWWSSSLNRLVFDIRFNGLLMCYQARSLVQEPKWLTCSPQYAWGKRFPLILSDNKTRPIILVEDIISAYKINQSGYNAMALLGCKINRPLLNFIASIGTNFTVWLDGDLTGLKCGGVLEDQLGKVAHVNRIITERDPKDLTSSEIKEEVIKSWLT